MSIIIEGGKRSESPYAIRGGGRSIRETGLNYDRYEEKKEWLEKRREIGYG